MSLLIKALDKAQAEKAQAKSAKNQADKEASGRLPNTLKTDDSVAKEVLVTADSELSLSPPEVSLLDDSKEELNRIPVSILDSAAAVAQKEASLKPIDRTSQKLLAQQSAPTSSSLNLSDKHSAISTPAQAANVFTAKRIEATHQNSKLAVIAGAGLIAMLAMGAYYYQFVVDSSEIVIPPRPLAIQPITAPMPSVETQTQVAELPTEILPIEQERETTEVFESREPEKLAQKQSNTAPQLEDEIVAETENVEDSNAFVVSTSKKSAKSKSVKLNKAIASESASIQVSQSRPGAGVNPVLMRAYEAYNAGKDTDAQKLYKQVLQRDISNVDAMLGLGAIAARQGRLADANDWYRKVLEVEPKNTVAQAAMLDAQQQNDPQSAESRIKSLLAKTPGDASLYTALGNLYAEQNQWPAAQQAYFDAFRLNESAENAYNLGVSLDQMGKPKLALPYYQQALNLVQLTTTGIDIAALQARIESIQ